MPLSHTRALTQQPPAGFMPLAPSAAYPYPVQSAHTSRKPINLQPCKPLPLRPATLPTRPCLLNLGNDAGLPGQQAPCGRTN